MEVILKRIRLGRPYAVHPITKQIYGFYQVMATFPDGHKQLFDSEEHAKAFIEKRPLNQTSLQAEFPAGINEAMVNNAPTLEHQEVVESERDSYNVVITAYADDKKIAIIKAVRELTGLGLRESKEMVTDLPKTVFEDVAKEIADNAKLVLEAAGAQIEVK